MKPAYYIIGALALWITISSCGPASKLRRAKRLIASAETSGATVVSDTVFKEVPVYVKEMRIDTVVQRVDFRDTITLTKDRVVTRIKIDPVQKTVYVKTVCPPDTINVKVPMVVNRTISAGYTKWHVVWVVGLAVLIASILWFLIGTFFGRAILNKIKIL